MKRCGILLSFFVVAAQCVTVERDAVTALRLLKEEVIGRDRQWKGIVDTWKGGGPDGEDDPCADGWKSKWKGVECRFQGDLDPEVPRVVTNIHVPDSEVTGPVPLAISLLRDLVEVDMDGNEITGPLNPYIGCLSNLKELDLANNSLTGVIPTEWRFLTKLEEVELEDNPKLTGCIPRGMPPVETVCPKGGHGRQKCFLIGTIVNNTRVEGFCSGTPLLTKRCPDVAFVKRFIEEGMPYDLYFQSQALSSPSPKEAELTTSRFEQQGDVEIEDNIPDRGGGREDSPGFFPFVFG